MWDTCEHMDFSSTLARVVTEEGSKDLREKREWEWQVPPPHTHTHKGTPHTRFMVDM